MRKRYIQLIISILLFLIASLVLVLSFISYDDALQYLNSLATDGSVESYSIELHQKLMSVYRWCGFLLILSSFIFYFFGQRISSFLSLIFSDLKQYARHVFRSVIDFFLNEDHFHKWMFVFILFIAAVIRLYFIKALPVLYDEAFSFIIYGNKPLFILTSYYSYPNNHLLHTILIHFSYELFGTHVYALRLPVFISGVLLLPLVYAFAKKLTNKHVALIAMALTAVTKPMILYSVYARGYMIITVLFVLSLLVAFSIIEKPSRTKWLLLSLFTALGIYTVPTYLFAVGGIYIWITISLWNNFPFKYIMKGVMLSSILGLLISVLFYSPIILFSGIDSLIANDYVSYRYSMNEILPAIAETFGELYANVSSVIPLTLLFLLIAGFGMSFFNRQFLMLYVSFILYFILFIFIQRMVPPERAVVFLIPLLMIGCAWGLQLLAEGVERYKQIVTAFLILIMMSPVLIIYKVGLIPLHETEDNKMVAQWLQQNIHQGDAVLCTFPIDYPIEFYIREQGQDPAILRTYPETPERYIVIVNREVEGQTVATVFQQTLKVFPSYNLSARLEKAFNNTDIYVIDGL